MKQSALLPVILLVLISVMGQTPANAGVARNFNDTTSTFPEGTVNKNGRLHLVKGYVIAFSEDKRIVTIRKAKGNIVTASVRCGCRGGSGGGKCNLVSVGETLTCSGDGCCMMEVTTGNSNLAITTKSGSAYDGNIIWKVLVIPKAKTNTSSN